MGSLTMTRRLLVTSVRKPSNGSMLTSWQKRRNMTTSRRNWKVSAILSSPSFTQQPVVRVVCQVVCQEECPVVCQEECQVVCQLVESLLLSSRGTPLYQPSKHRHSLHIVITSLVYLYRSTRVRGP